MRNLIIFFIILFFNRGVCQKKHIYPKNMSDVKVDIKVKTGVDTINYLNIIVDVFNNNTINYYVNYDPYGKEIKFKGDSVFIYCKGYARYRYIKPPSNESFYDLIYFHYSAFSSKGGPFVKNEFVEIKSNKKKTILYREPLKKKLDEGHNIYVRFFLFNSFEEISKINEGGYRVGESLSSNKCSVFIKHFYYSDTTDYLKGNQKLITDYLYEVKWLYYYQEYHHKDWKKYLKE